ncbi:MAG: PqiC family protein [Thiotrichaceae bacterium]
MKHLFLIPILLILTACSSLGGSSDSTRFYSLSSIDENKTAPTGRLTLGIGPVRLPHRLKRPQIVTRINKNELHVTEDHQWAGSLKEDITQVLTDNLSTLVGTEQIESYPWKRYFKPDFRIRVQIERLDGEPGKAVTLKARWWLRSTLTRFSKMDQPARKSTITVQTKGEGYTPYVAAQSRALYQLSQEIAAEINR